MKTIYMICTLGSLTGFLIGAGCWGEAEGHCGNLEGDQTCAEQGRGAYCDTCRLESNGCTDVRPSADCHFMGSGTESATIGDMATVSVDATSTTELADTTYATTQAGTSAEGTTVALSGESGTTASGPECMSDAECQGTEEPFCGKNGECVASCGETTEPNAACMGLGVMTPLCFEGACVACEDRLLVSDSATGSCVPCTEHDQCVSGACDIFVGWCFDPDRVIEVGDGGEPDTIAEGLMAIALGTDRLGENRGVLVLHNWVNNEDFDETIDIDATYDAVAFIAPLRESFVPTWTHSGPGNSPTLTVTGTNARVYLDQVRLWNDKDATNGQSLRCDGARVDIRRSRLVRYNGGGIRAQGKCELVVLNSFIGDDDNDIDAIVIANDAVTATILYSTLGGGNGTGTALRCPNGGPNVHVRNSLLVSGSSAVMDLGIDCPSATKTTNASEADPMVNDMNANWFVDYNNGDFHLTNNAPDGIIIADWHPGDPTTDIDGNPRITAEGQFGHAGADVP